MGVLCDSLLLRAALAASIACNFLLRLCVVVYGLVFRVMVYGLCLGWMVYGLVYRVMMF